jgi:hypothetical protein
VKNALDLAVLAESRLRGRREHAEVQAKLDAVNRALRDAFRRS